MEDKNKTLLLDFLYPIFKPIISFGLFRYFLIGPISFFINNLFFYFFYNSLVKKMLLQYGFSNTNLMALLISLTITIPVGFYMTKNFVDSSKPIKKFHFFYYTLVILISVYFSNKLLDIFINNLKLNITLSLFMNTFFNQLFISIILRKIFFLSGLNFDYLLFTLEGGNY